MRVIFAIFFLMSFLAADKSIFFMPKDANIAQRELIHKINLAKSSIDVAIYSFTHKKIAKALKKAATRGVQISIITNLKDVDKNTQFGYLAKYQNIQAYTLQGLETRNKKYSGKMHLKTALIDKKIAIYGSANWSNSAFGLNYEFLVIDDEPRVAKAFEENFIYLLENAKKF